MKLDWRLTKKPLCRGKVSNYYTTGVKMIREDALVPRTKTDNIQILALHEAKFDQTSRGNWQVWQGINNSV